MSDEMIAQEFMHAGSLHRIRYPEAFAVTGTAPVPPAEPGEHCISETTRICCNQPGCFL